MIRGIIFLVLFLGSVTCYSQESTLPHFDPHLRPNKLILLGEIHGTNEIPDLTLLLIEKVLKKTIPVTLFIEHAKKEQVAINTYLKSIGSQTDKDSLTKHDFWQRKTQDGRTSMAMLELIESIRSLKSNYADIEIVLIDNPSSSDRDKFMYETIVANMNSDTTRSYIGLVGNYHSRLKTGSGSLGSLLKEYNINLLSLCFSYSGGTAWVCSKGECGIKTIKGQGFAEKYKIYSFQNLTNYDGFLEIGNISASPPAKSNLQH